MIHLSWKEAATRTGNAESLEKIAAALKAAGAEEKIMVYYEFDSADELRLFSLALQMMPHVGDLETLQDRRDALEKEVARLQANVTKLSEIRRYTRR